MNAQIQDRIVACALCCEQALWLATVYEGNAQPVEAERYRQRAHEESDWAFAEAKRG